MVIFSTVILSLAGLSLAVARRTTRATDKALVMSVLLSRVDRAATIGYDSIPLIAVCDTTLSSQVQIIACITESSLSQRIRQVRVVVRTTAPGSRPDTITFQRGRPRVGIPLK